MINTNFKKHIVVHQFISTFFFHEYTESNLNTHACTNVHTHILKSLNGF